MFGHLKWNIPEDREGPEPPGLGIGEQGHPLAVGGRDRRPALLSAGTVKR